MSTEDVLGIAAHFEKMLYDNGQLARVYLPAWQVTGEPFYRTITRAYFHLQETCRSVSALIAAGA